MSSVRELRREARRLFGVAIDAADPEAAVKRALESIEGSARIGRLGTDGKIVVLALGKAAPGMADAALAYLHDMLGFATGNIAGVVVSDRRLARSFKHTSRDLLRLEAEHPIPGPGSLAAADAVLASVAGLDKQDQVLALISGGGSSLLAAPRSPITLKDKILINQLLQKSGATIDEMNCVRKHLSRIKGGQLTVAAAPARVDALLLSDVPGDDPSTIASGPTVPDPTSFGEALAILDGLPQSQLVPGTVRAVLEAGVSGEIAETPKPGDSGFDRSSHRIIGSNAMSLAAIQKSVGGNALVLTAPSLGEARICGETWAATLEEHLAAGKKAVVIAGGETTVSLDLESETGGRAPDAGSPSAAGCPGSGGRSQELALAFALAAERLDCHQNSDWVFLSAGTDGLDGPTDAAGAIVDRFTLERCRKAGVDPSLALARHDSYTALNASGDLIRTGATGTNVADVQILLVAAAVVG